MELDDRKGRAATVDPRYPDHVRSRHPQNTLIATGLWCKASRVDMSKAEIISKIVRYRE